jgi:hypothetical protein
MMEAVCTSQTSVYCNETTWHYIPEGSHLQYQVKISEHSGALKNLDNYIYTTELRKVLEITASKFRQTDSSHEEIEQQQLWFDKEYSK